MPINARAEYFKAQGKFYEAKSLKDKLKALEEMLRESPDHKGAEVLRSELKTKISKYKALLEKESKKKSGSKPKISFKKEGSATISIVGTTNSGKSTLLSNLTNAKPEIASYPYTTRKPVQGILDYQGINIQLIEIPAIVKDFEHTEDGPALFSIIKNSDAIILMFNNPEEKKLLDKELHTIEIPIIIPGSLESLPKKIWSTLNIIKVYTKQPRKKHNYPPLSLKKGSTIKDLASHVHKDFIKNFKFARVWGSSIRHQGNKASLDHKLADNDIVELHMK